MCSYHPRPPHQSSPVTPRGWGSVPASSSPSPVLWCWCNHLLRPGRRCQKQPWTLKLTQHLTSDRDERVDVSVVCVCVWFPGPAEDFVEMKRLWINVPLFFFSFFFTNCHNLSNQNTNSRKKRATKSRKQFPHHFSAPPSSSQPKEEKDSGWTVSQQLKLQCHTAFFLFLCGYMGGGGGSGGGSHYQLSFLFFPLSAVKLFFVLVSI